MKKRTRIFLGAYLGVGLVIYIVIKLVAGGVGLFGLGGPAGELLELFLVILAWPVVVVLTVLVVMQGR